MNSSSETERHTLFSNLCLLTAVLLILFIAAEFGLSRIERQKASRPSGPSGWAIIPEASWIEYHSKLGWFHQKNKSGFLSKDSLKIPLHTNSLGLRGQKEYPVSKKADSIRVYAIGDSFTFGFGVEDNESFPAQLQQIKPKLEVFNLGIPGYGIDQMALLLEEFGFSYKPDIVLITIYPEDFWRATRAFNDAGFGKPYFRIQVDGTLALQHIPVPKDKSFSTVQFPEFLERSQVDKLLSKSAIVRLSKKAWGLFLKKMNWIDPDSSDEWRLGQLILKRMIATIHENDSLPIIILAPPLRWITGTTEPIRESLSRFCKREDIPFVDLTSVFKEVSQTESIDFYYIPNDHHWTAKGNTKVAETILPYIETLQKQKINSFHAPH